MTPANDATRGFGPIPIEEPIGLVRTSRRRDASREFVAHPRARGEL